MSALAQCRGTRLSGARNLSRYTKIDRSNGAYPGTNNKHLTVPKARFAKTVTSLLTLLSVLADVVCPELLQGTRNQEFFERVT